MRRSLKFPSIPRGSARLFSSWAAGSSHLRASPRRASGSEPHAAAAPNLRKPHHILTVSLKYYRILPIERVKTTNREATRATKFADDKRLFDRLVHERAHQLHGVHSHADGRP